MMTSIKSNGFTDSYIFDRNRTDRIRLIRFPANVVWAVKAAIEGSWPRGIQNEREVSLGAYEFQLKGNPWTGQGDESVPARVLMCVFRTGFRSPSTT